MLKQDISYNIRPLLGIKLDPILTKDGTCVACFFVE